MKKALVTWSLLLLSLLSRLPAPALAADFNYPFSSPWVATILGTPEDERVPLVQDIPVKLLDLEVLPQRQVPEVFWYNERLRTSLAYQKGRAPLIFVIAGTGAGFNSDKMLSLQSIFYRAGFHVVCISSPTHANFITAASESMTPGILEDDASDLYRVMQAVWNQIREDIEVSDFHLTGYSLGGTQAAFVSMIDEEQRTFDFKRVLMINPPVSLYSSVRLLDHMFEDNVPGGVEKTGEALRRMLDSFATIYKAGDFVKFDNEFLYNLYRGLAEPPKDENLAALIGLSFRISASNMIFAADVMTHAGFVVPKTVKLGNDDSLEEYLRTLIGISFVTYLDEFLLPAVQARSAAVTRQSLIEGSSLKSIEGYLKRARKIGVLTNADEIILAPGELDWLREQFRGRAIIFPHGGHCGNIDHRAVAAAITEYFVKP